MTLNLDELEAVARAALPGRLVQVTYEFEKYSEILHYVDLKISRGNLRYSTVLFDEAAEYPCDEPRTFCDTGNGPNSEVNAAHIAAFSPTVALAMIAELRQLRSLAAAAYGPQYPLLQLQTDCPKEFLLPMTEDMLK